MTIKIHKHFVKNVETGAKAKCWYSRGQLINDTRDCIIIYAKEYGQELSRVFGSSVEVKNETDSMTDYFDKDKICIFAGEPLFNECLKFVS